MDVFAEITGIGYSPLLCKNLTSYSLENLQCALSCDATFILEYDPKNQFAISWWVSAKRTRSYPYARVYDTLSYNGRKVTIIPIFKDEGKDGDRDYLQWDTISLMSLLNVYVIISYYVDAEINPRYSNKITNQRFDIDYIKEQLEELIPYKSDALHWNLSQAAKAGIIAQRALKSYQKTSNRLGVTMHSEEQALRRIAEISNDLEDFKNFSRERAEKAQKRESRTTQPKEYITGEKGIITIKNYLGGNYYFTIDDVFIDNDTISLAECKHSKKDLIPKIGDVKDGLLKMIVFTNLENVTVEKQRYNPKSILKLTSGREFSKKRLTRSQIELIMSLKSEAVTNNFNVLINNLDISDIY